MGVENQAQEDSPYETEEVDEHDDMTHTQYNNYISNQEEHENEGTVCITTFSTRLCGFPQVWKTIISGKNTKG